MIKLKAIIFDVGGVLVPLEKGFFLELAHRFDVNDKKKKEEFVLFIDKLKPKLRRGEISFSELLEEIKEGFEKPPFFELKGEIKDGESLRRVWKDLFGKKIDKFAKLIKEYRMGVLKKLKDKSVVLGLLSNIDECRFSVAKEKGLFNGFEEGLLVTSFEVGSCKPEREIYKEMKKRLLRKRISPEQCLFVDDKIPNLESAKKMKFNVFEFKRDIRFFKENWRRLAEYLKKQEVL